MDYVREKLEAAEPKTNATKVSCCAVWGETNNQIHAFWATPPVELSFLSVLHTGISCSLLWDVMPQTHGLSVAYECQNMAKEVALQPR